MRNKSVLRRMVGLRGIFLGTAVVLWASLIAMLVPTGSVHAQQSGAGNGDSLQLPDGPAHDLVTAQCAMCHSLELVVAKRRTKADWDRIVNLMWRRQAQFLKTDIPAISDYLFANFGKPDESVHTAGSATLPAAYTNYDFSRPAKRGTLTGLVHAEQGQVRGFSVVAHNLLYRIRYQVFTNDGRYTVPQALPGPYEIYSGEYGYSSSTSSAVLQPGETKSVDLAVTRNPEPTGLTNIDVDTVYAPGPGRDLYFQYCKGCHANNPHYKMRLSPFGFRMGLENMRWGRLAPDNDGESEFSNTQLSRSQMDEIGKYLGSVLHAGETRVVRRPDYIVDEGVTSKAIFVSYDRPDAEANAFGLDLLVSNHGDPVGSHDSFVAKDGRIWQGNAASGGVAISLDPKEQDPAKRTKFYTLASKGKQCHTNGIGGSQLDGRVYIACVNEGTLAEVDPKTGKTEIHVLPLRGGVHSVYGDSKGNIWYVNLYGGQVAKFNPDTGRAYPYPMLTPDIAPYDVVEDHAGKMWITGLAKNLIAQFDPDTLTVKEFKVPTPGVGPRRLKIDSKGTIWFTETANQAFGNLDPETGQFAEFKLPIRNVSPYAVWMDQKDQNVIWGTDVLNEWGGYSPFSYNTKTKQMEYFPAPEGTFAPMVTPESNNTVWMGQLPTSKAGSGQTHFYPNGYTADAPPEP